MIPTWTIVLPAGLLLAFMVLAFETRPRVVWAIVGLAGLSALLLIVGVLRI